MYYDKRKKNTVRYMSGRFEKEIQPLAPKNGDLLN